MPTISDVAKRAGVSAATVSRVIQGARNVKPATRAKVEQAINELGYVPSAAAQSLRSKRSRSFALVLPDITNPFWTTVARGVEDVAHRHDYSVLLCNTDEDSTKQHHYLSFLVSQGVDGVIIAPRESNVQSLASLRERNIPTVFIDRRIDGWDMDSVSGDSVAGARAMVQHLLSLNHSRIAIVSGPEMTSTAEDRVSGYRLALNEAGIPVEESLIKRGEFLSDSGEALADQLLDASPRPTAIFAANNAIAMGVIDAVAKRNLRIPQDIAVVAFDDLPNVSRLFPFLTVVAQPAYDMGVNAAQLLLSRVGSEVKLRPRQVTLPTRLIVRHSCGSRLDGNGKCPISLPIAQPGPDQQFLVKPVVSKDHLDIRETSESRGDSPGGSSDYDKSDVNRLLKVLQYQEADRVPYLTLDAASRDTYEYVLERELEFDELGAGIMASPIRPKDQVDFALRLGMDAVTCRFSWPRNGAGQGPPPSLADQLSYLERYLRAVQGTKVGVIPRFSGVFTPMLVPANSPRTSDQADLNPFMAETQLDPILEHQEMVIRVVCDRFGDDLAGVMIAADDPGFSDHHLAGETFKPLFSSWMARLVVPALEHGKLLMFLGRGDVGQLLPTLCEIGFNVIHPVSAGFAELQRLKDHWYGRLAFIGSLDAALMTYGSEDQIVAAVREACSNLAAGGGFVLSSASGIAAEAPSGNLMIVKRAVQRFGRYGFLGKEVNHQIN